MTGLTSVESLVEPGRVHRRVYADPDIFEMEMGRIFGRAWIFVAHESQLPRPGDFLRAGIGREPLLVVRGEDGEIRVMRNRCLHRGMLVCIAQRGTVDRFACPYHGWVYGRDGRLLGVPQPDGYSSPRALGGADAGLAPVPRTGNYRGFVFASLAKDGPDLAQLSRTRRQGARQSRRPCSGWRDRARGRRLPPGLPGKLEAAYRERQRSRASDFRPRVLDRRGPGFRDRRGAGPGDAAGAANVCGQRDSVVGDVRSGNPRLRARAQLYRRVLRIRHDFGHARHARIQFLSRASRRPARRRASRCGARLGHLQPPDLSQPRAQPAVPVDARRRTRRGRPHDRAQLLLPPEGSAGMALRERGAVSHHAQLAGLADRDGRSGDLHGVPDRVRCGRARMDQSGARGGPRPAARTAAAHAGSGTSELPIRTQYRAWLDYMRFG